MRLRSCSLFERGWRNAWGYILLHFTSTSTDRTPCVSCHTLEEQQKSATWLDFQQSFFLLRGRMLVQIIPMFCNVLFNIVWHSLKIVFFLLIFGEVGCWTNTVAMTCSLNALPKRLVTTQNKGLIFVFQESEWLIDILGLLLTERSLVKGISWESGRYFCIFQLSFLF